MSHSRIYQPNRGHPFDGVAETANPAYNKDQKQRMSEKFFAYHSTGISNIRSIFQEGLKPSEESYRGELEADLETVADEKNISLPVKRQECVFLYPSLDQAIEMTTYETGPPGSLDALFAREGLLVIDATSFREDMYVADFDFFSDVIDLRCMDEPDRFTNSESYDAALTNYAKSVTPFYKFNSVDSMGGEFRIPELLIETDIPPSHIRETLLHKEVLGTGWFSSYPALPSGE